MSSAAAAAAETHSPPPSSAASTASSASIQDASKRPQQQKQQSNVPTINLRLILVSGKTKDFRFPCTESAGNIAQFVFDNWPDGEFANETNNLFKIQILIQ